MSDKPVEQSEQSSDQKTNTRQKKTEGGNPDKKYVKKGAENQTQEQGEEIQKKKSDRGERGERGERKPRENKEGETKGEGKGEGRGERREGKGEYRGGDRKGEGRGDRKEGGRRNPENKDAEGGENEETKKAERPKRESKYVFDRDTITLETVLPTIPKESEQLKRPEYTDLQQKLEGIESKIENIKKNRNQVIQNIRDEKKQKFQEVVQGREKLQPLKEQIKLKQNQADDLKKIFEDIRADYTKINAQFNKAKEEHEAIKLKMKKPESSRDIKSSIDKIEHTLANERIKPDVEKRLLRELEELHSTLPLCEPMENKKKELDQIAVVRNALKDKKDNAYEDWKDVDDEVLDLKKQQKDSDSQLQTPKEDLGPIIEERRNEAKEKIDELIEKKSKIRQEFEDSKTKYYEEQDLIHYVKWAKRQQDNLRKRSDYEARQDQRIEDEIQYEIKKQIPHEEEEPFKDEIATCAVLVHYLRGLIPSQKSTEEEQQKKEIDVKALQKEKLEVVVSKRDKVDESQTKGKKGKKAPEKKTEKKDENDNNLYHNYQIVQSFDSVSVVPPTTVEELQKTIDVLESKRQYFEQTRESEEKRLETERQIRIDRIRDEIAEKVKLRDEEGKKRTDYKGGNRGDRGDNRGHRDNEDRGGRGPRGDNEDRGGRGPRGDRGGDREEEKAPQQQSDKKSLRQKGGNSSSLKMDSNDFPQIQ